MFSKIFSEYRIDRKSLSKIQGSGSGTVTCADGATFSASAESMDSVIQGGDRWCRDHGGATNYFFVGDLQ